MSSDEDEKKKVIPGGAVVSLAGWKESRDRYRKAEAADWATLAKQLTRYAQKRIGRRPFGDDAEDLAQEAIRHFFQHMDGWDDARVPLVRHLASVLNGIAINRRRKGPNRGAAPDEREIVLPAREDAQAGFHTCGDREDAHAPGRFRPTGAFVAHRPEEEGQGDPERTLAAHDHAKAVVRELYARLAGDDFALRLMELFADGMDKPAEQALATGRPLLDVLAARRRIERKATQVRDELDANDASEERKESEES